MTDEERAYYSLNRRFWRVFAPFYDVFFLVVLPIPNLRREVLRLASLAPGSRILDVATGTGAQALAFAPTAKEVVGIDLYEAMLSIARRKNRFANVTFKQADAASLPFEDGHPTA
jgi:demethylmenaquinone methyltransferase/2-methoxy-6-polyprenyl-1,4-benzoquinol methylase